MNPKLTRADIRNTSLGFYLVGVTCRELVEQLGEPIQSQGLRIDDKIRVKFGAIHDDGRRLAVWDWKAGYISLTELRQWTGWGDVGLAQDLFGIERILTL